MRSGVFSIFLTFYFVSLSPIARAGIGLRIDLAPTLMSLSNSSQQNTTLSSSPLGGTLHSTFSFGFAKRATFDFGGGATFVPLKAPIGMNLTDTNYLEYRAVAGISLQFLETALRFHVFGGQSPLFSAASAAQGALTQQLNIGTEFSWIWLPLRGYNHDIGFGLHARYRYGLPASNATLSYTHGVGYGVEGILSLVQAGLPLGLFARSSFDHFLTNAGTQTSMQFQFGLRIYTRLTSPKAEVGGRRTISGE